MYDVCTDLPACIFGNDLFVNLIAMDIKCRFVTVPRLALDSRSRPPGQQTHIVIKVGVNDEIIMFNVGEHLLSLLEST